jgi:hypothetical protein
MRNARVCGIQFVVMAAFTAFFATRTWQMTTESIKVYGIQPGDKSMIVLGFVIFGACVSICGVLLARTIGWVIDCRKFEKEFGFKAPNNPQNPLDRPLATERIVSKRLVFLKNSGSRKRKIYVRAALLAEKFGYYGEWSPEDMDEYLRAHR